MADSMTYEPCLGADLTAPDHQHHWNNLLLNMASVSELRLSEEGAYQHGKGL